MSKNPKIQKRLLPPSDESKIIKYFIESDKLDRIQLLKNKKSNLILNLKRLPREKNNYALHQIGIFELQIADLEFKKNNLGEVYDALFSALNVYLKLEKYKEIAYNIALKVIIEPKFNKKIKFEMFKFLKSGDSKRDPKPSFDFFKYIINQYVENNYAYHAQNINKTPFFVFQNLNFNEMQYIPLNPYSVSIHPIYSKELTAIIENLIQYKAITIAKNQIIQSNKYYLVTGNSNAFSSLIESGNEGILFKINSLIRKFSNWDTKKIKEWEKKTELLDYFPTFSKII